METILQIGLSNALVATGVAVLAGLAQFCRCRPALVHALCLLVLLKLLTPPLVRVPIEVPSPPAESAAKLPDLAPQKPAEEVVLMEVDPADLAPAPAEETPVAANIPPAVPAPIPAVAPASPVPWATILGGLWLAGSIVCLGIAGSRIRRFTGMLWCARPAEAELQRQAEELSRQMGLAHCPKVWLVPGEVSPMLWTWGAPRLLLPADLWVRLDEDERATLLVHELAHLVRRDHWVRCLELAVTALYWWHPIVWWTRSRLREAEEQCCDAWVVWTLPTSGRAYAQALLETIDFLSGARRVLPPVASAAGQFPILKRRLTMILHGTTPRHLSAAGLIAIIGLGLLLLPLLPTWAQAEPPAVEEEDVLIQRGKSEDRKAEGGEKNKKEIDELTREMEKLHEQMMKVQRRLAELGAADNKRIFLFRTAPAPGGPGAPGGGFGGQPGAPGGFGGQFVPMPPAVPGAPMPPMPPMGGVAGVRVNPPDVLFFRGAGPHEQEILRAQVEAKKAQVREAEIHLQAAKEKAERVRQLLEKGAIGQEEAREIRTNVELRSAQLDRVQAELKETIARMAQAQAQPRPGDGRAEGKFEFEVKPFTRPVPPPPAATPVPPPPAPMPGTDRKIELELRTRPPAGQPDRNQELEKRLDLLMRELESIRKEIRR